MKSNSQRCGSCKFVFAIDPLNINTVLECRYDPPVTLLIAMTPKGPMMDSFHPRVKRDHFCWKFEPNVKDKLTN